MQIISVEDICNIAVEILFVFQQTVYRLYTLKIKSKPLPHDSTGRFTKYHISSRYMTTRVEYMVKVTFSKGYPWRPCFNLNLVGNPSVYVNNNAYTIQLQNQLQGITRSPLYYLHL